MIVFEILKNVYSKIENILNDAKMRTLYFEIFGLFRPFGRHQSTRKPLSSFKNTLHSDKSNSFSGFTHRLWLLRICTYATGRGNVYFLNPLSIFVFLYLHTSITPSTSIYPGNQYILPKKIPFIISGLKILKWF